MIDRSDRPLGFLDPELTACFVRSFEASGSHFLGRQEVASLMWNGVDAVVTTLESGVVLRSEKLLCALGRQPMLDEINLPVTGVGLNERGFIAVDTHCRTNVPHIYAVGDVIGPPSLAACSMEQGRRAIRHALRLETGNPSALMPVGIYTIPEMASIGLTEAEARQRYGSAVVGRATFAELARGQIAGITEGLLKLVADPHGRRLLGVQIVGEGATELVHVGEMSLLTGGEVDMFVDHVFNFPTLAEGYRVAALDIVKQRGGLPATGNGAVPDGAVNGRLALATG
jgi:NAD(P) transhydrogenase